MAGVDVVTFGCRLNAYESEIIRGAATEAGLADTVIVNTCAVTAEAERQARQSIRRARRERPEARIIVTGCAATLAPERYTALDGVTAVLDNTAKLKTETYRPLSAPLPRDSEAVAPSPTSPETGAARVRGYLEVQHGCDHRCTFCIIPYARGGSRSVPLTEIVARARVMAAAGCREIVLTGVDLTAYGADLPEQSSLGGMVRDLLAAVPDVPRLRLSSLDPSEVDEPLWELLGSEPRLMPHLHFSFQAGDDLILKRMKRRHTRAQALAAVQRARRLRPEVAIGADLIAGFPTESDDMFRRSLDLVEECGIAFLHVFPYSPRPGTPAARMPQLDGGLIRARAAQLREAGMAAMEADANSRIGTENEVLVERPGRGRATFYTPVNLDPEIPAGAVVRTRLTGRRGPNMIGVPVA
ncbi:MAG: tRNA (N(6)-L-threonylcarbamoyladenosine(37)-C(2))-methylthiotransferase MtaB [Alphaproteobacteria bacterium]|nr:tRNA (N(6)-L-threonylcarbamoyladenosine(37)-C(2))-methylthiotransferase MtaB [Alphaproteobacteria bacterium]